MKKGLHIRRIKKEATDGDVSSTENGRDSHINSDSKNSITENGPLVKGQFGMKDLEKIRKALNLK